MESGEWSRTPPTEPGWYWVKLPSGDERIAEAHGYGKSQYWSKLHMTLESETMVLMKYEFGEKIPSNRELYDKILGVKPITQ